MRNGSWANCVCSKPPYLIAVLDLLCYSLRICLPSRQAHTKEYNTAGQRLILKSTSSSLPLESTTAIKYLYITPSLYEVSGFHTVPNSLLTFRNRVLEILPGLVWRTLPFSASGACLVGGSFSWWVSMGLGFHVMWLLGFSRDPRIKWILCYAPSYRFSKLWVKFGDPCLQLWLGHGRNLVGHLKQMFV